MLCSRETKRLRCYVENVRSDSAVRHHSGAWQLQPKHQETEHIGKYPVFVLFSVTIDLLFSHIFFRSHSILLKIGTHVFDVVGLNSTRDMFSALCLSLSHCLLCLSYKGETPPGKTTTSSLKIRIVRPFICVFFWLKITHMKMATRSISHTGGKKTFLVDLLKESFELKVQDIK